MAKGFDRRRLLQGGCAVWALGGCPQPPPPSDKNGSHTGDTGLTDTDTTGGGDEYPCGQDVAGGAGWTELPLSQYPDLADVGGWYGVTVGGTAMVVAQVYEGCYTAITRACAHQGVAIDYKPERGQFVCPRHGAIYAPDGSKVAGPQPDGLPVHPCGRVGDSVWVKP